jgi:hypothetical protein
MQEKPAVVEVIDSFDEVEHCPECGHAWVNDEPAHYADCRYFILAEDQVDEEQEESDVLGWRSVRPALL